MNNLKDRGYPQAKTVKPNLSDKKNALMNSDVNAFVSRGGQAVEPEPKAPSMLDRLVTAYNNRAFANPSMPLVQKTSYDYVDDNTDSRANHSQVSLWNRDNNRLGVLTKQVIDDGGTYYGAGIDNLAPILGDRYFSKEFNTPLGTISAEYDGDTLSGGIDVPYNKYYFVALKNLLDRGTL